MKSEDKPEEDGKPHAHSKIDLPSHPLVAKMHPEPDSPTDLVCLTGYLGPSKKADCVRLYTDLSFRRYYEIPTNGIVHTQPTDAKDENSPTKVVVLPATKLDVVQMAVECLEASYLQGPIATGYLGGSYRPDPFAMITGRSQKTQALHSRTADRVTAQEFLNTIEYHQMWVIADNATNDFRHANGVGVLNLSPRLFRVAREYALFLAINNLSGHYADGHDPGYRVAAAGITSSVNNPQPVCGVWENFFEYWSSPPISYIAAIDAAINFWINSPAHRENLLRGEATHGAAGAAGVIDDDGNYHYKIIQLFIDDCWPKGTPRPPIHLGHRP